MSIENENQRAFIIDPEAQKLIFGSSVELYEQLKREIEQLPEEEQDGRIYEVAFAIESMMSVSLEYASATQDLPHGMQHSEQLIEELLAFQKALLAEGIVPIGTEWYTILPYDAQVLLALLNTTPRYTRDLPGDAEQYGFDMDQALATLRDLRILAESDVISLNIKIDPIEPVCNSFRVVLHSLGLA